MSPRALKVSLVILLAAVLGMGLYLRSLTHRAELIREPSADLRPVSPPVNGTPERVALFVASDASGGLQREDVQISLPQEHPQRAREILHALIGRYQAKDSPHPLPGGADVRDVYIVNDKTAVIDVNSLFADAHRSGILVEELTVTSMIQTLAANLPGITRVKFLVEGSERETLAGHADLSNFYDVSAVAALASELR
jgi:sporulation and spore germination protein